MSWDSEHFDPLPPASIEPPPQQQKHWLKRLLAPLSGIALLIWKVAGPLLLALKNVKLFAFSATFLVSLAAYTSIWGWRFALGFMLLLMVHELGHVIQLRREGVPASAPMFIPFMGAFVGMKEMPKNAWAEAKVGLAGPVLGAAGRGVCLAAAIETDSDLLRAVAYTAFFLNLFNLIPVVPLDGGRAAAAFHPAFWFVGRVRDRAAVLLAPQPADPADRGAGLLRAVPPLGTPQRSRRRKAYYATTWPQRLTIGVVYLGLIGLLVLGMEASYLHRRF